MTVLLHELMHQLGQRLDAAISGADDRTMQRFASEYEGRSTGSRCCCPRPRRQDCTTGCRWSSGSPRAAGDWPARPSVRADAQGRRRPAAAHLLSFFDTAGEELRSQQSVEQNVRYLAAADGIVLVLDPLQMHGARRRPSPAPGGPPRRSRLTSPPPSWRTSPTSSWPRGARETEPWISKPLAIVFSKMDTLFHEPARNQPAAAAGRPRPHISTSGTAWRYTRRSSGCWPSGKGTRIDQLARLHYRTYRYFGVSALGETSDRGQPRLRPRHSPATASPIPSCGPSRSSAPSR